MLLCIFRQQNTGDECKLAKKDAPTLFKEKRY
jgi:hypothetical protein